MSAKAIEWKTIEFKKTDGSDVRVFRNWLSLIGLSGDEFIKTRKQLLKHLISHQDIAAIA